MNNTNKLTGVVIDAGHGGSDSGAIGENTYEKDYNLLISQYMYNRLKELGIPVYITRDSDETITPANRTKEILEAFGNDPNVVVISNHLNAGGGEFSYHYKEIIKYLNNLYRAFCINSIQRLYEFEKDFKRHKKREIYIDIYHVFCYNYLRDKV